MKYPGGKNSPGVYHSIINQIPPHEVYIEPFAGSAAIFRYKREAAISILVDKDTKAIGRLFESVTSTDGENAGDGRGGNWKNQVQVIEGDGIEFLKSYKWLGKEFVYADPPYLDFTRRQPRPIYRHELSKEKEHRALLNVLLGVPAPVALSAYWSELYGDALKSWRMIRFQGMTRGGHRSCECLWMNYSEPIELHDYSYLGRDNRERQDLKRMQARWVARLKGMPTLKRQALLGAIYEFLH